MSRWDFFRELRLTRGRSLMASTVTKAARRQLVLESLEDRCMPSTTYWTGMENTNWSDPNNWTAGVPGPGPEDFAVFDGTIALRTTCIVDMPEPVGHLELLASWSGSILLINPLTLNGDSQWESGTINLETNGRLNNNGTFTVSGSGGHTFAGTGTVMDGATGAIDLTPTDSDVSLSITGNATLAGSSMGEMRLDVDSMGHRGAVYAEPGATLTNAATHTIRGPGDVGAHARDATHFGTVVNNGTIDGVRLVFDSHSVLQGTSDQRTTGMLKDDVSVPQGSDVTINNNASQTVQDILTNDGTIDMVPNDSWYVFLHFVGTNPLLTGTGYVTGSPGGKGSFLEPDQGPLTIDSEQHVCALRGGDLYLGGIGGLGNVINKGMVTAEPSGYLGFAAYPTVTNTQSGIVEAITGGKVETLYSFVGVNNQGTVEANGGTVHLTGPVAQVSGNALTGGTWEAFAGGRLDLGSADIRSNAAQITLSGPGSTFPNINALSPNTGTFSVQDGATFRTANDVVNQGVSALLSVGQGSTLTVSGTNGTNGSYTDFNGTTTLAGGSLTTTMDYTEFNGQTNLDGGTLTSPAVTFEAGVLAGSGVVNGDLVNDGTVQLGGSAAAGILSVTGTYTQDGLGALYVKIGGYTPGSDYDQLNVAGLATLAGKLDACTLLGDSPPNPGDTFRVLTFGARNGDFTMECLYADDAVSLTPQYTDTTPGFLDLLAVAVPSHGPLGQQVPVSAQPLSTSADTAGSIPPAPAGPDRDVRVLLVPPAAERALVARPETEQPDTLFWLWAERSGAQAAVDAFEGLGSAPGNR